MSSPDNSGSDWSDVPDDNDIDVPNGHGEATNVLCLFCSYEDGDVDKLFCHIAIDHHVIMKDVIVKLNLDFYSYIKFINYIRKTKASPSDLKAFTQDTFASDNLLQPVLEEDMLLQYDIEALISKEIDPSSEASLKANLDVAEGRAALAEEFLERTLDDLNKCRQELNRLLLGGGSAIKDDTPKMANGHLPIDVDDSEGYFSTYAHYGIHEEMLKDKVRTSTYQSFILNNKKLFEGARVLDVGCGTSVLSMFASQAGAKEVIGVDNSEVAYQAMDIVQENKLNSVIKIQKGRAEELSIEGKVDIIISEWMGYFLLFESMLDTVLFCRDNYLSATGCLYPDQCNICLLALDDSELYDSKVKFWDSVYGFKMAAMKRSVIQEPLVTVVNKEKVISDPFVLKELDLMTATVSDLEFWADFKLMIRKDAVMSALVGYFDISFEHNAEFTNGFSTSPSATPTHWKQTVFFLKDPIAVKLGDIVEGRMMCRKHPKDSRAIDITVDIYSADNVVYHQLYSMV